MAKGKSAVALFEVINKDRRFSRKSPEIPRATMQAPVAEPVIAQKSPKADSASLAARAVDLWRKRNSDPETWTFSPVKLRKSLSARFAAFSTGFKSGLNRSAKIAETGRTWVSAQDSVLCGIAAALIIIGCLLGVRHLTHPASHIPTIDEALRAGPAHPAVLEVSQHIQQPTPAPAPAVLSPEMQLDVQQASEKTTPEVSTSSIAQPGARIINMHYVLMQSYFEEKTAIEARDFLAKNQIPCTIERGVKGWRQDFYQVIGLQGFARPSGTEYKSYIAKIESLGKDFSPHSRYKRFVPQAIKW